MISSKRKTEIDYNSNYLNSDLKSHRNLLFPAPVACLGVDEEVSDVCLVLLL